MTGQRFDDVEEVMILVKHRNGRQDGWIVNSPDRVEWRLGGIGYATVTIRGEFYRKAKLPKAKSPEDRTLEEKPRAQLEALESRPYIELEAPDGD